MIKSYVGMPGDCCARGQDVLHFEVPKDYEENAMSRKQFQMVCGLWVTPDFSDVLAGRVAPPHVNHSQVDFAALAKAIEGLFHFGPPVRVQVVNDTIDQVAVHLRSTGEMSASMRCEDFGTALLKKAAICKDQVINIQSSWHTLHALPDRDFAPPPVIIPFVVTATDFEDAMIWHASTRPSIGLPVFNPLDEVGKQAKELPQNGTLPDSFRQKLKDIFGAKYEAMCVLDRMAMNKVPTEYKSAFD